MEEKAGDQNPPPRRPRRPRRSSEEIQNRILTAASDEFEAFGYAGATTAAIARSAGVAEALIFSNFGSKAKLFEASIFEPLNREMMEFCSAYAQDNPKSAAERDRLTREYLARLERFLDMHSGKFKSLLFEQTYRRPQGGLDEIDGIQGYFTRATRLASSRSRGDASMEPGMVARVSFAAIFACVVLREWLFPAGFATKDEIFAALSDFVVDGLKRASGN